MSARILYLEDDEVTPELARLLLIRSGIEVEIVVAADRDQFLQAYQRERPALVLSDSEVPGFSGREALAKLRGDGGPRVPFVFVSGAGDAEHVSSCLRAGADDFVTKDQLWRLPFVAKRVLDQGDHGRSDARVAHHHRGLGLLVEAVKALSLARSIEEIAVVVRRTARELNGADGATFVLRDGDRCHYFDEDAISPLWKGLRFPADTCISGWAMKHGRSAAIEDIYADPRIPADAYRPTFVKSLVMVPVRREAPMAAIGNYWATPHKATPEEIDLIQALADSTAVAMENVRVYSELESRVRERTAELEAANRELETFSGAVSHDLRTPLAHVMGFGELLEDELRNTTGPARDFVGHIVTAADRMNALIDDLLRLSRSTRVELARSRVDLSAMARSVVAELAHHPTKGPRVEWQIDEGLSATADPGLLRAVLANLLSNAVTYSSKQEHPSVQIGSDATTGTGAFFVRDNGVGFDPSRAARLFTPFSRLHSSSEFPGTGLGLATCHRIIQRHGGRLWATSAPGQGATFFFTLPEKASVG